MRLVILCRDAQLYSVRRMAEAARARGHAARVLEPYRFLLGLDGGRPSLRYGEEPFGGADLFLPRLGAGISEHSLALLRHLEAAGMRVINSSASVEVARDKLRTLQLLAGHGLPVPRTAFAPDPARLPEAIEAVGGPPVVLKLPRGTQGKGVMLAAGREQAQAIADFMWSLEREVLVQEYVDGGRRGDLRLLAIGGGVAGAVRRRAMEGEFRTNLHQGGSVSLLEPSPEARDLALRAATLCGLEIAGVDLVESERGLLVLEVNAAPGFE
ncbi:MAG: RimK family alpha-L-glutamate ligase, partial [Nitrospinota bacterium]